MAETFCFNIKGQSSDSCTSAVTPLLSCSSLSHTPVGSHTNRICHTGMKRAIAKAAPALRSPIQGFSSTSLNQGQTWHENGHEIPTEDLLGRAQECFVVLRVWGEGFIRAASHKTSCYGMQGAASDQLTLVFTRGVFLGDLRRRVRLKTAANSKNIDSVVLARRIYWYCFFVKWKENEQTQRLILTVGERCSCKTWPLCWWASDQSP